LSHYDGPERRVSNGRRATDYGRTRILGVLVIVIVISTIYTALVWRNFGHTKASVSSLQKTNNALVQFLCTAKTARLHAAASEHDAQREIDLKAAAGYTKLIKVFDKAQCDESRNR